MLTIGAHRLEIPPAHAGALHLVTFGCVFLSAAVTVDTRLAPGGVTYLAAFLVAAAKPSAVLWALGIAYALAGLVAIFVAASVLSAGKAADRVRVRAAGSSG